MKEVGTKLQYYVMVIISLLVHVYVVFTTNPESLTVFLNSTAEFRCQHSASDIPIEWRINGTPVSVNHPPEVTIQGGNPRVLSLVATSEYNGTVFDCVAESLNSNMSEISKNATVLIQGMTKFNAPTIVGLYDSGNLPSILLKGTLSAPIFIMIKLQYALIRHIEAYRHNIYPDPDALSSCRISQCCW